MKQIKIINVNKNANKHIKINASNANNSTNVRIIVPKLVTICSDDIDCNSDAASIDAVSEIETYNFNNNAYEIRNIDNISDKSNIVNINIPKKSIKCKKSDNKPNEYQNEYQIINKNDYLVCNNQSGSKDAIISMLISTVNNLTERVEHLENSMKMLDKNELDTTKCIEIKIQKIDPNEDDIRRALKMPAVEGDAYLLKQYYLNDASDAAEPIRMINKRRFEYWADNIWNVDIDGTNLKKILSKNLQQCYLRYITFDRFKHDNGTYLQYQERIHLLSNEKHIVKLFSAFKEYVKH